MPRLTSTAKGGFYPFNADHLPAVASLFKPPGAQSLLLDPCAGDGVPLERLAAALNLTPYANELDIERAAQCAERFGPLRTIQSDLLTLRTPHNAYSLIWLNPPYTENVSQSGAAETRREFEYLKHCWKWLQHGGYMCWVIYHHHLTRRAIKFLLENSRRVDVYRVPNLHLGAYRQVVVVAQKSLSKRDPDPAEIEGRLERYSQRIDSDVPELTVLDEPRYALPEPPDLRKFYFRPDSHSPAQMLAAIYKYGAHLHHTFQDITRPAPPAQPLTPVVRPRGGQIGLILAAGIFDGLILDLDYGPAAVRGVTRQVEIETTPEHLKGVRETFETRPVVTVSLLYKDGRLETIDGDNQAALIAFLKDNREALLAYIDEQTTPLYTFDYDHLNPVFAKVFRQRRLPGRPTTGLFETQKHVVGAAYATLQHKPGVLISGEMGVGKTAIGATLAGALYARGDVGAGTICVVMCPPHLTRKWEAEFVDAVPGTYTEIVKRPEEVSAFIARAARAPERLHVMVLSENAAKLSEGIAPAPFVKTEYEVRWPADAEPPEGTTTEERIISRRKLLCPTCCAPLTKDKAGQTAASMSWLEAEPRFCHRCGGALWQYKRNPSWSGPRPGEKFPRKPPRYPVASLLAEQYRDRVGVAIVDEVHQNKNAGVGRGEAMQRLVAVADKAIGMTGTLFGGVASTLFWLEWAFNPSMYRLFPIGDTGRERGATLSLWSRTMGVMERVVEYKEVNAGSYTQVKPFEYQPREAPGITPRLVAQLLDHTIWVSLSDMAFDLPDYEEVPVPVDLPPEVQTDYDKAKKLMLDYIQQLRLEGDNTFTSTYLYAALRHPSACFRQKVVTHTPKELKKAYKQRGETAPEKVMVVMKGWGEGRIYPKEEELITIVRRELDAGRRVLVYVEQTGTLDIQPRLADLLIEHVPGAKPVILTTSSNASSARSKRGVPTGKPATDKRDAWVKKQVRAGRNIMICNPRLVATGLDLVDFHTIVVYETPYSLYTLSQASRRTWRIGQTKDCRVFYLYYRQTMEEQAISLVSKKQAAAALLGGDAEGGGLAQLSTGGSLSLEAELARLIAEDEQVVDASQLFRENARRSLDFTSGWATSRTTSSAEPTKGQAPMPDDKQSGAAVAGMVPDTPAVLSETSTEVPAIYSAAKKKYPDVLILVDHGKYLQTYKADADRLTEHLGRPGETGYTRSDHTALIPADKSQALIAALNEVGVRVAVIKASPVAAKTTAAANGALRALQDEIIALGRQRHMPDDMRVSVDLPESLTLAALGERLYPTHETALRKVLKDLKALGAPAGNGRKPTKTKAARKTSAGRTNGKKAAPTAVPGITPTHPNADLLNKSFYDDEHRLTTVTGLDDIFPDTHVKVLRTLPDGSRKTYSLPADKARRFHASDPVDTPQSMPIEASARIPGLTGAAQTGSTSANGQQKPPTARSENEKQSVPIGGEASTGQAVQTGEPAAEHPGQDKKKTLRVGDTFTYEDRTYQLHSVTPESDLYPEGEFRADDLSGGIPLRRVFTSLTRFEQTTSYQVERAAGEKCTAPVPHKLAIPAIARKCEAGPAPVEDVRYKVFCVADAADSEQAAADNSEPLCLLATADREEACAFARSHKAEGPDNLITVADMQQGRVILTPTLSHGSWMNPAPETEPEEPTTGEGAEKKDKTQPTPHPDHPSEVQWLIEHAAPQVDFENQYALIPGSGIFAGTLPRHMVTTLRRFLKEREATVRDGGKQVYHSWKDGDVNYTIAFGSMKSTANRVRFTFTPDHWPQPDQPPRRDVPYTLRYEGDWTWLAFGTKPVHSGTLDALKTMGFRWSKKRQAQYADRRIPPDVIADALGYPAESVDRAGQNKAERVKSEPPPKPHIPQGGTKSEHFRSLNHHQKQQAKVTIARALREAGWTLYGFAADRSNLQADVYQPARWAGMAEKDGCQVVVDADEFTVERSGQNGWPRVQQTPGRANWHLESGGEILAKGTGLSRCYSGYYDRDEEGGKPHEKAAAEFVRLLDATVAHQRATSSIPAELAAKTVSSEEAPTEPSLPSDRQISQPLTLPTVASLVGRVIGELIDTDGESVLLCIEAVPSKDNRYRVATLDDTSIPAFSTFSGHDRLSAVLEVLKTEARKHHRYLDPVDLDSGLSYPPAADDRDQPESAHPLPTTDEEGFAIYRRVKQDHPAPLVFVETPGGLVTYLDDARTTAEFLTLPLTRLPIGTQLLTPKASIRKETGEVHLTRLRQKYAVALSNGSVRVLDPLDGPLAETTGEETINDPA